MRSDDLQMIMGMLSRRLERAVTARGTLVRVTAQTQAWPAEHQDLAFYFRVQSDVAEFTLKLWGDARAWLAFSAGQGRRANQANWPIAIDAVRRELFRLGEEVHHRKRPTPKWWRMAELYAWFGREFVDADWSLRAAIAMFHHESKGSQIEAQTNGYAIGKHLLSVTVEAWNRDILDGLLIKNELYSTHPRWRWWLDRVLWMPPSDGGNWRIHRTRNGIGGAL